MKITIEVSRETNSIEITSDEPLSLFVASKIFAHLAQDCIHIAGEEGSDKDINEIGHRKDKVD